MPEQIALVNDGGQTIGYKLRADIQHTDAFHSVFVLLITPARQLILSKIGQKLSATAVAMRRGHETPEATALRAVPHATQFHHLGDQFYTQANGRKIYLSVLYATTTSSTGPEHQALTAAELDEHLQLATPALHFIWQSYRHLLPV